MMNTQIEESESRVQDMNYEVQNNHVHEEQSDCGPTETQYSLLYNESENMYERAKNLREQLLIVKEGHQKQIKQTENEEYLAQQQFCSEMVVLQNKLSLLRHEYETQRIEFEQNMAMNENSNPVCKETRQLVAGYKVQNEQLKAEVSRLKRKWKDAVSVVSEIPNGLKQLRTAKDGAIIVLLVPSRADEHGKKPLSKEEKHFGQLNESMHTKECRITELKKRVKMLQEKYRVSQMTTDSFQSARSYEKEMIEIRKVIEFENHRLICHIKNVYRKHANEANKHAKKLEKLLKRLKSDATIREQEREKSLNEVSVTGQTFEEIQKQNRRLKRQLSEKDAANCKLMSERVRSNQQQMLLQEKISAKEKEKAALDSQYAAETLLMRHLEMQGRSMEDLCSSSEKELSLSYKALEEGRKKSMELAQLVVDLKFQVEKLNCKIVDAKQKLRIKTAALEEEAFKTHRVENEISVLRRKLEGMRETEMKEITDEFLVEKVRSLKKMLECPGCKVRRKDSVLVTCFHIFCHSCLKVRSKGRHQKCLTCGRPYEAKDVKRICLC
ncbi:unnamed protein product [Soboliphyme baturini]|uniref:E3 ubiquitin protein ligase n=1 Tax=Soboliphyme baturini TaxID=241478 RepID=A0A183IAU3_9BILA|nr:unnamed protein product [Soboliphyme baturini]